MSKGKCKKCEEKCGKGKASPDVLSQLELGYEKLFKSDSPSMLKRFLTKEMFDKLKFKKTSFGSTLLDCIQSAKERYMGRIVTHMRIMSALCIGYDTGMYMCATTPVPFKAYLFKAGKFLYTLYLEEKSSKISSVLYFWKGLENLDSGIGVYAADPECYSVFADLFDQIIQEYHTFSPSARQPPTDWGPSNAFGNLDPTGQFVVSTRVRCCRTLKGFPLNPCMTEDHYKEIENLMQPTFSNLSGELKGTYNPLVGMPKDVQQKLIDDHYLFKEGDRFLQAANACRFWPTGRGIYFNAKKSFLVWICEEDHLRIMSMQPGGNVGEVFGRMVNGVKEIQKNNEFVASDRFGYLTFCPTNLGTTIRASVHIKVPKLAGDMTKFKDLADKYHLQIRGAAGEHSESKDGVYDLSNKRRLGLTEYQCMKEMYDGITEIIKAEKAKK